MKKNILQRIGGELIALIVLVPLVVVLGLVLLRRPAPSLHGEPVTLGVTPTDTTEPTATPVTQIIALEVKNGPSVQNYTIPVTGEVTVADLLEQAKAQGLQLVTKDYGGSLGLFIESMNGQASDPATQRYWHLYLNNKRSPLGASSTRVKAGDSVRWSFEKAHNE